MHGGNSGEGGSRVAGRMGGARLLVGSFGAAGRPLVGSRGGIAGPLPVGWDMLAGLKLQEWQACRLVAKKKSEELLQ